MGVTKEAMLLYAKVHEAGILDFSSNLKVVEIGAQQVYFKDNDFLKQTLPFANFDHNAMDNFALEMPSRKLHQALGFDYDCIDLDPIFPGSLQWDLNVDSCQDEYKGKYDICSNLGTTEHLIGQQNSFKLIHDLVRPGGVMIHMLPAYEPNHGFFSYSPAFFRYLAKYNNYKIVGLYLSGLVGDHLRELVPYTGIVKGRSYLHAILQKTNDAEFASPSQIYNNGVKG